jgi:hypothetical protein
MENRKKTILFFSANATGRSTLKLTEEASRLSEIFEKPELEPYYEFERKDNISVNNFLDNIRKFKPWFLHFSGHGIESGGIVLEKPKRGRDVRIINKDNLSEALRFCGSIQGVFFNSCHSSTMAEDFTKYFNYFIGVHGKVKDTDALIFSETFYKAFADFDSIDFAIQYMKRELTIKKIKVSPCIKFKKNLEMNPILLEQLIEEKQRTGEALDTEIIELKNLLFSIKEKGMSLQNELLEDHPHKLIVYWFVTNRETLAMKLAKQSLPPDVENDELDLTTNEINTLFEFLELTLISYDLDELLTSDEIAEFVDEFNHHPKIFYKKAILKLSLLADNSFFSNDSKSYFKNTVEYYCSLY